MPKKGLVKGMLDRKVQMMVRFDGFIDWNIRNVSLK